MAKRSQALARVEPVRDTVLKSELEHRFLEYALSTIVSRALPDVRDGLKPVHRRILYSMSQLGLSSDTGPRKCAAVVGEVLGKYHPHGDQAAYDALVRLAQDFSLRYPLVNGQGNFGSIDGDSAAAMRYTEAKLTPLAEELLAELKRETVGFRSNYDGTLVEPEILPARFPNILVNGSSGIAVGMATSIPPHNMTEVIDALIALIENRSLESKDLVKYVRGPDFPTGGQIIASKKELRDIYETGHGSVKIRGEYKVEDQGRGKTALILESIPYTVNKSKLIEKIAELIVGKKLPAITDIRDESTDIIRVVLELRKGEEDPAKVMSFIYKHTDLEFNFPVNITALTLTGRPARMGLKQVLDEYSRFRFTVVTRRLEFDLKKTRERLHVLEAYIAVYTDLDKAIRIIRKSQSRDEARKKLMSEFTLDELQANAILDLRLAALVGLEMRKIKLEHAELKMLEEELSKVLGSDKRVWTLVKKELSELRDKYGDKRKTKIASDIKDEVEYNPEDFIEHEMTNVVFSQKGWVRRMKTVQDEATLKFRDDDAKLEVIQIHTSCNIAVFTSAGKAYVTRALNYAQKSGFGDPVQMMFKFGDGEQVVSVLGLDAAGLKLAAPAGTQGTKSGPSQGDLFSGAGIAPDTGAVEPGKLDEVELLTFTELGQGFRFRAGLVAGETTRSGKKFASVKTDAGDGVIRVSVIEKGKTMLFLASSGGKVLLFPLEELPELAGPGGGVRLMKLSSGERIVGAKPVGKKDVVAILHQHGKESELKIADLPVMHRAQSGRVLPGKYRKPVAVY